MSFDFIATALHASGEPCIGFRGDQLAHENNDFFTHENYLAIWKFNLHLVCGVVTTCTLRPLHRL